MNSTRSSDSYDAEWAAVQERNERALDKVKQDSEEELASAKEEYQSRLKDLRDQANEDVRKLKDENYGSQGKRLTEMERDNLQEKKRITDSYETSLEKARKSHLEQEKNYEGKLGVALSEANERTRSQIATQKEEFSRLSEEKKQEANEAKKVYEEQINKERTTSQRNTEDIVSKSDAATNRALAAHSAMYNEYLKENQKNTKAAIAEKDQQLKDLQNTPDTNKISLSAKNKIEQTYQSKYQNDLDAERGVNAATIAAMRERDQRNQQEYQDNYSKKFNDMTKDYRQHEMAEKQVLVHGYQDLETQSSLTQKRLEDSKMDQAQRAYQKHTSEMSLQEQRNQERLEGQRATLLDEKFKTKDEMETKQRDQEREFAFKLNDTRRDLEKKLLDQKDFHEQQMSNVKFEFDKKLQEQERISKRMLDERVRAYELQLKTQESMHKEHDRLLTEHYEEELDSIKRTNARITQAKS